MPTSAIPDILTDALAGRYVLERELGRGGMATVYLAQDLRHKRRVALKVIDPELGAAVGAERFRREIEMAAELQHPHVLPVFDSGEAGASCLWYTMPYVEGESLRERIRREGRLPIAEALRLAREIAEALNYAHRRGVVHRDIKPGNILLSEGHALVADFGIARQGTRVAAGVAESPASTLLLEAGFTEAGLADSLTGANLTSTGMSLGTPAYMSPEQALGARDIDGRSDQYAVGCVLYEMLAGIPPYTGESARALIGQHLTAPVPNLRAVRPEVPPAVTAALVRALAKSPEARFATAAEFAAALERAAPAPTASLLTRYASRRGLLVATGALIAAGTIGGIALLRWRSAPSLDGHLVAVAPFEVLVPELAVWREQMVDHISRGLDGAGALRAVPLTTVLGRWEGRADPAAATAFGHRTGAGLVVYGQLLRIGQDSVRIVATLVDSRRGTVIAEARGADLSRRVNQVADAVAVEILWQVGSAQRVGRAAPSRLGSRSPAAVRAFLAGEEFYRRAMWDSASARYKEAIQSDTNFTLAYWHLGRVLGWDGREDPSPFYFQAAAHTRGLAPRDSVLITADSIMAALQTSPGPLGLGAGGRAVVKERLFQMLADAANRNPGDAEVWYSLGEARYHWGAAIGESAGALGAFERSIALDTFFVPAYVHVVELKLNEGDPAGALRYMDRMRALGADSTPGTTARTQGYLLRAAVSGAPIDEDSVTGGDLRYALQVPFARWPDSGATTVSVARALVRKAHGTWSATGGDRDPAASTAGILAVAAQALGYRGRVAEAAGMIGDVGFLQSVGTEVPALVELALLGAVPTERVERALRANGATPEADPLNIVTVRWWGARRDTVAVRRILARLRRGGLDSTMRGGVDSATLKTVTLDASAYLALARRDTASALRALATLTDSLGTGNPVDLLQRARLLAARGALDAAVLQYRALVEGNGPLGVVGRLELGELAERQGARELALESYRFVAAIWKHADPVLQPYVTRARAGLARLTSESRPSS